MPLPFLALLAALWAGLLRLGWALPSPVATLPAAHGPLMIAGFLGSLISLERAVALTTVFKTRRVFLVPALSGLGALALILGATQNGAILIWLASAGLTILFAALLRRHRVLFTWMLLAGAAAWFVGNGLWALGRPIHLAVWWWAGFLVLTIAGERLELSRITRLTPNQQKAFAVSAAILAAGLFLTFVRYDAGVRLVGLGELLLAAWLLRYDIARRTIRQTGLPRFTAACLLSGYVWLAAGGVFSIVFGGVSAGPLYGAMLHAVFLGFGFAMIFGHAPIIFPAVMQISLPFRPRFYIHLGLLHITLLLRVVGDLAPSPPARQWGGLLNVIVLLFFLINTATAVQRKDSISP